MTLDTLSTRQLTAVYNLAIAENAIKKLTPVLKFKTKEQAVERIARIMRDHNLRVQGAVDGVPLLAPVPKEGRRPTMNREPKSADKVQPCREGTNQAILLDLLFKGVSVPEATRIVNEQTGKNLTEGTIRSTIGWDICVLKGYGVESYLKDGIAHYKLVLPEGMDFPLNHIPRKKNAE